MGTRTLARLAATLFLQLVTDFMGDRVGVSHLNFDMLKGTAAGGSRTSPPHLSALRFVGSGTPGVSRTQDNLAFVDQ